MVEEHRPYSDQLEELRFLCLCFCRGFLVFCGEDPSSFPGTFYHYIFYL